MIVGNHLVKAELVKQLCLALVTPTHHRPPPPQIAPGNGITPVVCLQPTSATWGNSGIEPDRGKGISSPGTYEASPCGLATMESGNGILCRTGRVVDADIDLCGGPDGVDVCFNDTSRDRKSTRL